MSRFLTLNVGATHAVLAEYQLKGRGELTLAAYGSADLAAVSEAAGSLGASLTPAILAIMRETGIRPGPLVLALNGQAVFPRFAKFPPVSADKLEELVRYEIEQNVPFPIDEIVADHQFTGDTPEGDRAAMIVAAKLEQVREVTAAVSAAGLSPAVIDVSPMAVYNAFRGSAAALPGCSVILDMGARTTSLILAEDEKIYNRSIPTAGNTVTKELAQAFGCSLEEAERLKLERGYVSLGGVTEDEDEVSDRVSKVIRTVLTRLHAEISRSINFYRSQQGGNAPARLILTGGSVRLPQLDEFFRETLQIEVGYLNPFEKIALGPKINREKLADDAFTLAESAGLALRMTDRAAIAINLMPPELIAHARAMRRIPFVVTGGVCALAALGLALVAEMGAADCARAECERVTARTDALRQLDAKLKAADRALVAEQEKCDRFQKLLFSRSAALAHVKAVRDSLVPGMWITAWEPAREGDGAHVVIRGWKDDLAAAERRAKKLTGGKASPTAAELVQNALKTRGAVVPESVKIATQRDVKDCLSEFAIDMLFAPPKPVVAEAEKPGKRKGGR